MLRFFLSIAGYFVYTLVVLVCLLWLLFPGDSVRAWLEHQLDTRYPAYEWGADSLGIEFPGRLVFSGITIIPIDSKSTPLVIDRVSLSPDWPLLLHKKKAIKYDIELLKGEISGQLVWGQEKQSFIGSGNFVALHLKHLQILQQILQRSVDGILSGNFTIKGMWPDLQNIEFQGNADLAGGTLQFKAPVLGLDALAYTSLTADFKFKQGQWSFEQGKLNSPLMNGTFSGFLQAGISFAASSLQCTGNLEPRSEMFASVQNKQMARIVRTNLKNGRLPFTLNGTAGEPVILFTGELSQALKKMSGSTKKS